MHKKVRFKTVFSLDTRFWKSYKRNSDLKHGLNEVAMIEIEKREPCLTFSPRDKLRRMTDAQWYSPREQETRSGENSYKRSSVKPCFSVRKIL